MSAWWTLLGFDPGRILLIGTLVLARVLPIFTLAPVFGGRLTPPSLRIAISVAVTVLVFPSVDGATAPLSPGPLVMLALLAKETTLGFVLTFLVSTPIWAAEAAGRLIDTTRGAQMSDVFLPQTGGQTSPLGDFLFQLAIVVFFAIGGHLLFVDSVARSYAAFPVASMPAGLGSVAELAIGASAGLLVAALGIAAPVVAVLFLTDLALGLVNRVAAQIQVYFLGLPVKATAGVLVLVLALGSVVVALRDDSARGVARVRAWVGGR